MPFVNFASVAKATSTFFTNLGDRIQKSVRIDLPGLSKRKTGNILPHANTYTPNFQSRPLSLLEKKSKASCARSLFSSGAQRVNDNVNDKRNVHTYFYQTMWKKRGRNILLMGSPGAGKTSVAKQLAKNFKMVAVDIDDHLLEPIWGMTVAEKLAQVGGKEFLDLEAQAFLKFKPERALISLTGSQPMNDDAMAHAKKLGLIIYLDVHREDILARISSMKVDRIIGFDKEADMEAILRYREQFYERHYDMRVICEPNESVESMTRRAYAVYWKRYKNLDQGFSSTRAPSNFYKFMDVTIQGLAPDRGLFVTNADIPYMSKGQWERLVGVSYTDCALRILEQWIPSSEMSRKDLRQLVGQAYTREEFGHKDIAPIVPLENNQYLQELFHGPTGSFKDIALQLTARMFEHAIKKEQRGLRSLILVATSGDTGGAVMNAYTRHSESSEVLVLFPEDGVSAIQKAHLTSYVEPRCLALGVKGDFDFCQTAIKDLFTDKEFEARLDKEFGYRLCSANSINFARLLPQVVYHAWSYLLMVRDGHISMGQEIDICVPTGNFGNILGAYYAKKMGIPIRKMTLASNDNNVLHDFFTTGVYDVSNRTLLCTSSPAIDILRSSNLERYLFEASGKNSLLMADLFNDLEKTGRFALSTNGGLFKTMQQDFQSGWCTDEDCLKTIKDVLNRTGYLMDPHTAVAKTVADRKSLGSEVPVVISATAHYSKFADGVLDALGLRTESRSEDPRQLMCKALTLADRPSKHNLLMECVNLPRMHKLVVDADQGQIQETLENYLSEYFYISRHWQKR